MKKFQIFFKKAYKTPDKYSFLLIKLTLFFTISCNEKRY